MTRRTATLAAIAVLTAFLWACGGNNDPSTNADTTSDVAQADLPTLVSIQTRVPLLTDTAAATEEAAPETTVTTALAETEPVDAGGGDSAAIERGQTLAQQCMACHSVDGSILVGPTWQGLYGRDVTLADGTTIVADDAYITQSIRDPGSQVVDGFPPSMPPFTALTDQEIADIIAYIATLAG